MLDRARIQGIVFDLDGTLMALRGGRQGGALGRWLEPLAPLLPDRDPAGTARRLLVLSETPTNYALALLDRSGLMHLLRPLADRGRRLKGIGTLEELEPLPGAVEVVATLAARYPLAVLTNRARREAYGFLEQHDLRPHFAAVTTRQDLWRFKPHPEAIRRSARLLSLRPDQLLMVGDMPVDMETAHRAGAQAVGVLTGFATTPELTAAGADVVLQDVVALRERLDG